MPVMIQLRNVPDDLHRKLKARAAQEGMSLSAYLIRGAEGLAQRPTVEEWGRKLAKLKRLDLPESPTETIRKMRDGRC